MDTNYIGWEAVYNDGTTLSQFGVDGEKLFKDINQDILTEFRLHYKGRTMTVFLNYGVFSVNGFLVQTDVSAREGVLYRLVNFVRRSRTIGTGIPNPADEDEYFIGFQTTIDGTNHKRLVAIKDYFIRFTDG
jgi:hypothetical protein